MDRTKAAKLWHEIYTTPAYEVFPGKLSKQLSGPPQPGYIGSAYDAHRVVFIGKNPAGESASKENDPVYHALEALQGDEASFDNLNAVLQETIPTWKLYSKLMRPVLEAMGIGIENAALINLLAWRTDKTTRPEHFYEESWNTYTSRQIDLLAPKTIFILGDGLRQEFKQRYKGRAIVRVLFRTNGDTSVDARTEEILKDLRHQHSRETA